MRPVTATDGRGRGAAIAVAVLVLAGLALGGAAAWVLPGTVAVDAAAYRVRPAGTLVQEDDRLVERHAVRTGEVVTLDLRVRNTRRVGVRVTLPVEQVVQGSGRGVPSREVRIPAGGTAEVTVTFRVGGCLSSSVFQGFGSVPVSVWAAGMRRDASLPLPVPQWFTGPRGVECPPGVTP